LLKHFPDSWFIGAMLLPGLLIVLLLVLPFIDRNPKRHFLNRPLASVSALLVVGGILALTVLSVREAPPPQVASPADRAAELYTANCANCHGPAMAVPPATDLHQLIAEGKHEGMPAWGGDLSTDEIDALAAITSWAAPCTRVRGATGIFVLASGNPQSSPGYSMQRDYLPHAGQTVRLVST
jgi:mono/diheme cytochrome c family protein